MFKWQIFSTLCCYKCSSKKQERYYKQQQQQQLQQQQEEQYINVHKQQNYSLTNGEYQVPESIVYCNSNNQNLSTINNETPEGVQFSSNQETTQQAVILKISESENSNGLRKVSMMSEISGTEHQQQPNEGNRNVVLTSPPMPHPLKGSPKLYPPGRILHIVRKYSRSSTINSKLNGNVDNTVNASAENNPISSNEIIEKENLEDKSSKGRLSRLRRARGNSKNQLTSLLGQLWTCKADSSSSRLHNQKQQQPVYQIIETDNKQFNELLISPRMLQDHMPDNLIRCMKAVLDEPAPRKPPRHFDNNGNQSLDSDLDEIR
jgi:hypothetical protein